MISIDGAVGKGTLWGTFSVPATLMSSWCTDPNDYLSCVPPSAWYLPPPDSVWYNVLQSPYGPKVSNLKIGWINSTVDNEFNPCTHSTIRGNAVYRGLNDSNCPSLPLSIVLTSGDKYQLITGHGPSYYSGLRCYAQTRQLTPSNGSNNWLYDRYGARFAQPWYNNPTGYYSVLTHLSPTVLSDSIRSTLPPSGAFTRFGEWYGRKITGSGGIPPDVMETNRMHYCECQHLTRTLFSRYSEREYHAGPATPVASISHARNSTKIGRLIRGEVHNESITVTHVRSTANGIFWVRFAYVNNMTYEGWEPWDYRSGAASTSVILEKSLCILAPGLTQGPESFSEGADSYCLIAPKRARELYNFRNAKEARTNAVRDVSELSSNWIENLAGVKGTMKAIQPLIDGYKAVKNGDLPRARRALAGGYLVYKYVIAPGIDDAVDIRDNGSRILGEATVNRFSNERRRGLSRSEMAVLDTSAQLLYTCTYHLQLKSNYFSQIWNALEKIGLDPTAGQLWDLVPYSFVADWFIPVGDSLRNVEAYNSLNLNRNLRMRIEGFKVQWKLSDFEISRMFSDTLCANGSPLVYSWYDRRIYPDVGSIDLIASNSSDGLTLSQMAQGAALLTQYKR